MNSETLPSFWSAYASLPEDIKRSARKAYQLWADNPFHPSLRFKCINHEENIWSVRITRSYRALGFLEGDTVTCFGLGAMPCMNASFPKLPYAQSSTAMGHESHVIFAASVAVPYTLAQSPGISITHVVDPASHAVDADN